MSIVEWEATSETAPVVVDAQETYWHSRLTTRARRMKSSAVRELLKVTERPNFISFAGGLPAPAVFPIAEVARVTQRILQEDGARALQYSATEGFLPLRQRIADKMRQRGIPATLDNVMITTGSQQALDLIGKVLIEPKDPILLEGPSYLAALQAWRVYGADFRPIAMDAQGLIPSALETAIEPHSKLLYTIPTFQNPSGSTLSLARRHRLVEIGKEHNLPIIEDDPYRQIRFEGGELPLLIELDAKGSSMDQPYAGHVVYLSTFSKVLAPGLRVGSIVGPVPLIQKLVQAKQSVDLHTPTLNQMVAYELDKAGVLAWQAERVAATYKERRDVMLECLQQEMPCPYHCETPEGGMFLWLELPVEYDTQAILDEALLRQVAFVPGCSFFADGSGHHTMRLNFSNTPPDRIRTGVERLAESIRVVQANRKS